MSWLRTRLTYANVMSSIAVFAVLGGGAYAAQKIGPKDISKNAVRSKHIKNRGVKPNDLASKAKQRLRGNRGPQGPAGPPGPTELGNITRVERTGTVAAGDVDSVTVSCPSGRGFVSGGFSFIAGEGEVFFADTFGSSTEWAVGGDNFDSLISGELTAIAFCAPAGRAVTPVNAARVRDRADAAVARQKAKHGL